MPNSYFLVGWPGLVGQLPGFPGCPGLVAIWIHLLSLSVDLAVILGVQINPALWLP